MELFVPNITKVTCSICGVDADGKTEFTLVAIDDTIHDGIAEALPVHASCLTKNVMYNRNAKVFYINKEAHK